MPYLIDLGILEDRVERSVPIDFRINSDGLTPLMLTSKYDNLPLLQLMLSSATARVYQMDNQGRNAMHVAACYGHVEVSSFLSQEVEYKSSKGKEMFL